MITAADVKKTYLETQQRLQNVADSYVPRVIEAFLNMAHIAAENGSKFVTIYDLVSVCDDSRINLNESNLNDCLTRNYSKIVNELEKLGFVKSENGHHFNLNDIKGE